jgi:hypothetical protein
MTRFRRFCALGWEERRLFCESLLFHLIVGLVLKVVPFRWIPRLFASRQFETPAKAESRTRTCPDEVGSVRAEGQSRHAPVPMESGVSGRQSGVVEKIQVAVQRAGWISPWRNRCLVSSLAARWMLRRRKIGSELSLGVAKDTKGNLVAHAWLKSGDFEIVEKRGSYTELFLF